MVSSAKAPSVTKVTALIPLVYVNVPFPTRLSLARARSPYSFCLNDIHNIANNILFTSSAAAQATSAPHM